MPTPAAALQYANPGCPATHVIPYDSRPPFILPYFRGTFLDRLRSLNCDTCSLDAALEYSEEELLQERRRDLLLQKQSKQRRDAAKWGQGHRGILPSTGAPTPTSSCPLAISEHGGSSSGASNDMSRNSNDGNRASAISPRPYIPTGDGKVVAADDRIIARYPSADSASGTENALKREESVRPIREETARNLIVGDNRQDAERSEEAELEEERLKALHLAEAAEAAVFLGEHEDYYARAGKLRMRGSLVARSVREGSQADFSIVVSK